MLGVLVLEAAMACLFLVASWLRVAISAMLTILVSHVVIKLFTGGGPVISYIQLALSGVFSVILGPAMAVAIFYGLLRLHQRIILSDDPDPLAACLRTAVYTYTPIIPYHLACLFMLLSRVLMPQTAPWIAPVIAVGLFVGLVVVSVPVCRYLVIPRLKLISYKKFRPEHSDYLPEKNQSEQAEREARMIRGFGGSGGGGTRSLSDESPSESPLKISQLRSEEFFLPLHLILSFLVAVYDGGLTGGSLISMTTMTTTTTAKSIIVALVTIATMTGGIFGKRAAEALGMDLVTRQQLTPSRAAMVDFAVLLLPALSMACGVPVSLGLAKTAVLASLDRWLPSGAAATAAGDRPKSALIFTAAGWVTSTVGFGLVAALILYISSK